jgi:hypothetical protein
MICPECTRTAMTFAHFLLVINPRQIRCQHCGATLVWTPKWKNIFSYSIILTFFAGYLLFRLRHVLGVGIVGFCALFVLILLLYASIFWQNADYAKGP